MVCADDTMIAGDWVDVVASEENVSDILTESMEKKELGANDKPEEEKEEERLSLERRQQRQKQAQLAFLKDQGLFQNEDTTTNDDGMVIVNHGLQDDSPSLDGTTVEEEPSPLDAFAQAKIAARKAGVAAAGGALVAVGAVLTPLPTPGGILLAGKETGT
jgi:hypothetical protein